jgi:hypothetical protein
LQGKSLKVPIRVPGPVTPGRKSWRKLVADADPSRPGGYAYLGEWLPVGRGVELEAGSYVPLYDEVGDRAVLPGVSLARLGSDGVWQARFAQ